MTSDENLRARLAAIDPIHQAGALDPVPTPSRTDIKDHVRRVIDDPTDWAPRPAARRWRRPPILAAAAAIVAAAAIGVGALVDAAGNGSTPRGHASTTVALTATPADAMASWISGTNGGSTDASTMRHLYRLRTPPEASWTIR